VFEGLPPDCRPTRGSDTRDEDDSCSAQEARR
jgi:hypothetical protein